jgi:MFS family permease
VIATGFRRRLQILSEPNVLPLASATLFNAAGNNVYSVALGWLAYDMTKSPLAVGAVLGFRTLPMLFMGLLSGAVNDRMHRPTVLRMYTLYYTTLSFGFTSLLFLGDVRVPHMLAYMFLVGLGFAFGPAARRAIYADSVPRSGVVDALAVDATLFGLGHLTMPAIVGLVLATYGAATAFALQGVLYSVMTILAFRVQTPRRAIAVGGHPPILTSIRGGLSYARHQPGVLRMLGLASFLTLLGADFVTALVAVISVENFGAGAQGVGLMLAGVAAGGMVGPMALLTLKDKLGTVGTLAGSVAVLGLGMVAFALAPTLGFAIAAFALIGAMLPVQKALTDGYIQLAVHDEYRGRVGSLIQMTRGVSSLSALLAGTMAQFLGVEIAIAIAGVTVAAGALWSFSTFRRYGVDGW